MRVRFRPALVLALVLASGIGPLLHAAHGHEPCHPGLHVAAPHESGPAMETCALCRTSQVPGPAPAPAGLLAGGHAECAAFAASAPRPVASASFSSSSPRAPPSLLSRQA